MKARVQYRGKEVTVMPGHRAVLDCYKKNMLGQVVVEVDETEGEGIVPSGEYPITENGEHNVSGYATAVVNVQPLLEEKTVTPTEVAQVITAKADAYGLSSVTIEAIQTEEKTATENGTVEASEGKYLKRVNVSVPVTEAPNGTVIITKNGKHDIKNYAEANVNVQPALQQKTISPNESEQVISPDENYYGLESVTVEPIQAEAVRVSTNGTVKPEEGKYFKSVEVDVPIPDGYVKPVGAFSMPENGTYDVTRYEIAKVNVQPPLQEKNAVPAAVAQEVTPDTDIYGLSKVVVAAVPTEEVTITDFVAEVTPSEGKFIRKVNVNVPTVTVHSGTTEPTDDIGQDGDIYLLLEE